MWFEKLTGFKEETPSQVRKNLYINENKLISKINGREFIFGNLTIPTLGELKKISPPINSYKSNIKILGITEDVKTLHNRKENNGALFQVASQFNLLEMTNPSITPEMGVDIYEQDPTQGPACAVSCGAGTIYRNYFLTIDGYPGQTSTRQIDCLSELAVEFNNDKHHLWIMKNGYPILTKDGLLNITKQIESKNDIGYEKLKDKLRIGIQWETEVTLKGSDNLVTQAYCSALPISYSNIENELWESLPG